MNKISLTLLGMLTVSRLMLGVNAFAGQLDKSSIPYSTPAGITLVNVSKLMDDAIPQFLWRRLGDAQGKPLYTYDADKKGISSCYGQCAEEFTPFVPDADAKSAGDYSIISRKDGMRQWAYQGKALYRYAGKDPVGEPVGQRFQLKEDPTWADPASIVYTPKQGWRRVSYTPEKSTPMPPDVELSALAVANGFAFVNSSSKMTIYAAPPSHTLSRDWQPLRASALALPVGEFSIVKRAGDGSRQWTYKKEPLYTYAGDLAPGEVEGSLADKDMQAALAYQNFMPSDVDIGQYLRGPLLTTGKGQTLYTQARYQTLYGGTETRTGYGISYNEAKTQGAVGCDGECTETWKPLLVSDNAKGRGYWEVYTRPDGAKQWSFKGSPLYTYVGDSKPGDAIGNNRHVVVYGGAQGQIIYANPGNDPHSLKAQLGKLSMKDVEEGRGRGAGRTNTPGQANAGVQANAAAPANDAGQANVAGLAADDANRNSFNSPGFYWHSAVVLY
jgi:predicted lipoprotein with Yx(FWY)xxD motif